MTNRTCACGCGQVPKSPESRFCAGHNNRGGVKVPAWPRKTHVSLVPVAELIRKKKEEWGLTWRQMAEVLGYTCPELWALANQWQYRQYRREWIRKDHAERILKVLAGLPHSPSAKEKREAAKRWGYNRASEKRQHGTINGYKTDGCRCDLCRQANSNYYRSNRERYRKHGRESRARKRNERVA